MRRLLYPFLLCLFTFIFACQGEKEANSATPFACSAKTQSLDQRDSMLVLHLAPDLRLALDARDGSIYKLWKGQIASDSTVYPGQGLQQLSTGPAFWLDPAPAPFQLLRNATPLSTRYTQGPTQVRKDTVLLQFTLTAPGLDPVPVTATLAASAQANPTLHLGYRLPVLPSDVAVVYRGTFGSLVDPSHITGEHWATHHTDEEKHGDRTYYAASGELALQPSATTTLDIALARHPKIANPNDALLQPKKPSRPEGARLIARSDCRTCHNNKTKSIGPSYLSVAQRYEPTQENIDMLVAKVKLGGTGNWGKQIMNAHPGLPDSQIEKMITYILEMK